MQKFRWISVFCILNLVLLAGCKVRPETQSKDNGLTVTTASAEEDVSTVTTAPAEGTLNTAAKRTVERKGSLVVGDGYAAYLDENGKLHILYDTIGVTQGADLEKKYTGLGMDRSTLVTIDEEGKPWGYYIFTIEEMKEIEESLKEDIAQGGNVGTGTRPDPELMRSFAELSGVRQIISYYPLEYTALLEDGTLITHRGNNAYVVNEEFQGAKEYADAGADVVLMEDGSVVFGKISDSLREKKLKEEWPSKLKQICSGDGCLAGLKEDGTVIAEDTELNYLINTVEQWSDITYLAAASGTIVGLKSDGTVVAVCKSTGDKSQCAVTEWKDIVAVDTNGRFTVGIKEDGTVLATGVLSQRIK